MPSLASSAHDARALSAALREVVAPFQAPRWRQAVLQVAVTLAPLLALLGAMHVALSFGIWPALLLALPAAGLVVRLFIIQHDCGHGAFFRPHLANQWVGRACSLFTLTPYANWRRQHAGHHAMWNNLDHRDSGVDIYSTCLTVAEFQRLSSPRRLLYRITCNPVLGLLVLPPLVFIALYRVPFDTPRDWRIERHSVHATNLVVVAMFTALVLLLGPWPVLLVHLPVMVLAAIIGVWLFSVQHRFESTRWLRDGTWDPVVASLSGSSYLRLPRLLEWFTGHIGYHHVHHLNARVPNYSLRAAHQAVARLVTVPELTLGRALKSWRFTLWDEAACRMVRFPPRTRGAT